MARRIRVFLGCSTEVKDSANIFRQRLSEYHNVFPWWEAGEFESQVTTFDALVRGSQTYDAAAFIFSEDDLVRSRGQVRPAFRDNVLFEFGLFLGTLKAPNLYAVIVRQPGQPGGTSGPDLGETQIADSLKIPTDLAGVNIRRVDVPDADTRKAQMAVVAQECAEKFAKLLPLRKMPGLVSGWSHSLETGEFTLTLSGWELTRNKDRVGDLKLLIAAIRDSPRVGLESNGEIAVGTRTDWPSLPGEIFIFGVPDKKLPGIQKGDRIHLLLLLCPPKLEPKEFKNLNELFDAGCFLVESVGLAAKQPTSSTNSSPAPPQ